MSSIFQLRIILIATLSQHLNRFKQKSLPNFEGGSFVFRQYTEILGKITGLFVVLAGLEPATSPM